MDDTKTDKTVYELEPSPKIRSFVKKPRRVIYTLYQEIENKFDPEKITFARFNNLTLSVTSAECIPAQKFIYNKDFIEKELKSKTSEDLPNGVSGVKNTSLYQFFKQTMAKPDGNTEENSKKFTNLDDWVHIYELMRIEGLYDLKSQDPRMEKLLNSVRNNTFFE